MPLPLLPMPLPLLPMPLPLPPMLLLHPPMLLLPPSNWHSAHESRPSGRLFYRPLQGNACSHWPPQSANFSAKASTINQTHPHPLTPDHS